MELLILRPMSPARDLTTKCNPKPVGQEPANEHEEGPPPGRPLPPPKEVTTSLPFRLVRLPAPAPSGCDSLPVCAASRTPFHLPGWMLANATQAALTQILKNSNMPQFTF